MPNELPATNLMFCIAPIAVLVIATSIEIHKRTTKDVTERDSIAVFLGAAFLSLVSITFSIHAALTKEIDLWLLGKNAVAYLSAVLALVKAARLWVAMLVSFAGLVAVGLLLIMVLAAGAPSLIYIDGVLPRSSTACGTAACTSRESWTLDNNHRSVATVFQVSVTNELVQKATFVVVEYPRVGLSGPSCKQQIDVRVNVDGTPARLRKDGGQTRFDVPRTARKVELNFELIGDARCPVEISLF